MNKQSFSSNKLVPFSRFAKKNSTLTDSSVMVDKNGIPLGFVFGRDSFISFLQHIDDEFEKRVHDPKIAFNNPAGRPIDLIEEKLPLNPKFVKNLKQSIKTAKRDDFISLEELSRSLDV